VVDVQDDGACKRRYNSRIFIARLFGMSGHGCRSAWLQIAICRKSAAPAPLS